MSAIASNITVFGLFGLTMALILIYRQDTARAAARKDEQNEQWGIELAKVSGVLATTQELLQAQQDSNKIILEANSRLTEQVTGIQAELREVRNELTGVREQLRKMTARAEAAEDKVD